MIYGPVIMNAEVLAAKKEPEKIMRLGIGQQRRHLQGLIREAYPNIGEIVEVSPRILPYSLTDGQIDGAVLDVTKASLLPGFQFTPLAKHDYISYVLVVRKDLIGSDPFERFLKAYHNAVDSLQEVHFHPALPKDYIRFLYLD